jgi:hypothetical protein
MKKFILSTILSAASIAGFSQVNVSDPRYPAVEEIERTERVVSTNINTSTSTRYCPYCHHVIERSNNGCDQPISSSVFFAQMRKVKMQTTVTGKKLVARKIASTYCLTANQVYELVNELVLTANKLEVAKFCYTRCYDPENYEIVYNAFSTSAAVDELDNFIADNGGINDAPPIRTGPENGHVPGYSGQLGCARPMTAANFASAKQTIAAIDFDNTKMETAKTITSSNCLTADQVAEICKLFDFESNKLEYAKFAYAHTYDKGNYFKVNNVFDFDNSKSALNQFIQKGGK